MTKYQSMAYCVDCSYYLSNAKGLLMVYCKCYNNKLTKGTNVNIDVKVIAKCKILKLKRKKI